MKTLILGKPIIAVAGSSGKTTTKEMLASILQRRWKVYKSPANRNNRSHLLQHAKMIAPSHQAAILEYGMSARGHLRQSCHIIQPNITILTMIGTAHIGNVGGTIEGLIQAKSEIIFNMKQSGLLLLNADDVNSRRLNTAKFMGTIVYVGINHAANYQATEVCYTENGMNFKVKIQGFYHNFSIPIWGIHNVYNALFAIAVADRLGFSPRQMIIGIKSYLKPSGRLRVFHRKKRVRIIDDTFNANPNSVKAAIDVLSAIGSKKTIAVLGNMSELGRYSARGHKEVGKYLADKHINYLFTIGTRAQLIAKEAIRNGFPPERVIHAKHRKSLHSGLRRTIAAGSTVLVKGSHDMMMNKTVNFLKRQT